MNVVFISPNFPPQFYLFCRALKAEGVRVLGIGDGHGHSLSPELRSVLDEYYFVADMHRHDEMVRALGYYTWKYGRIDRIDSLNEYWLQVEARLREDFNVFGLRPKDVEVMRSKQGMKAFFEKAGVKCPAAERYTTPEKLRAFAKSHGYPLVLKPDTGVGAARTFKVQDAQELEQALGTDLTGYLAEEFVNGTLLTFDGLTDHDGHIVFSSSLVYSEGVMETVNKRSDMAYWTQRVLPPALEEVGRRSVQAFNIRERFFHFEFFHMPDGSYRALEVNLRPPGGFTTDMMNWSADADVYRLWAEVIRGKKVQPSSGERPYHAVHVARRHGKHYRHTHAELVEKLGDMLIRHVNIPAALAGAMGDEAYFLRHPSFERVQEAIRLIQQLA